MEEAQRALCPCITATRSALVLSLYCPTEHATHALAPLATEERPGAHAAAAAWLLAAGAE